MSAGPNGAIASWDIVRVDFASADQAATRRHPALVIAAPAATDGFAILCVLMITSAIRESWLLDVPISELRLCGLTHRCVVRVSKVTTLDERLAARIGELSTPDRAEVATGLRTVLSPCFTQADDPGIAYSPVWREQMPRSRRNLGSRAIRLVFACIGEARATYGAPVPGVNETPRRTSPKPAVRSVLKLSVGGSVVAVKASVTTTSLLGSAPWSPLPLTVEVMAQIVTVPSPLICPLILRRPSVAGDHGRPVAALLPVG
jgi:mRNA-degrading endonuclease toxin of MazEF toxin-antitoxin module